MSTSSSPSGFIEKHDWWIVDQLQSNGQSLSLATRQMRRPGFRTVKQSQCHQDVLDLREARSQKVSKNGGAAAATSW